MSYVYRLGLGLDTIIVDLVTVNEELDIYSWGSLL